LGAVGAPKILEFFFVFTNNDTILGSVWLLLEIVISSGLSSTKHTLYTHTHTHTWSNKTWQPTSDHDFDKHG
jgi:hypothetical protein